MKKSPRKKPASRKTVVRKKPAPKKPVVASAPDYDSVLSGVVELLQEARRASARTVNAIMTATYWEVGRRIVEGEQGGKERADYGKELLKRLSLDLTGRFGRGFSVDNLQRFRSFFVVFPLSEIYATASRKSDEQKYATSSRISVDAVGPLFQSFSAIFVTGEPIQKSQTPSGLFVGTKSATPSRKSAANIPKATLAKSDDEIVQTPTALLAGPILRSPIEELQTASPLGLLDLLRTLSQRFPLPWSHYVRLLSVKNPLAREFYEIEALRGGWTVKQLSRQIGTQFYERTALSRNKAAMLTKGQQSKPEDAVSVDEEIKDSFVLEFLGLKDEYSESELEEALIRHLETFLLELGGDFTFVGRQRRLRSITPKAFHNTAQGRKRSERTLGWIVLVSGYPEGVTQTVTRELWNPFRVRLAVVPATQGALAKLATLGCVVERLRRNGRQLSLWALLPDEKLLADELTRTRRLLEARLAARPTRRKS